MSGDLKSEVLKTIQDLKGYLGSVKQENGFFPGLSSASEHLMDQWTEALSEDLFFSQGPETASVYIVDSNGRFYAGKSGELLVKILGAMKLSIDQVFICNADDMSAICRRIEKNAPKVMITLGSKAGKAFLQTDQSLELFRGKFFEFHGIQVMPTFHPSLLIKDPRYKRQVWEDMQQVMACAGLNPDA